MREYMKALTTDQIIEAIKATWDMPEGGVIRDHGFDEIEDRLGEEESDRIYDELWHQMKNAA